MGGGDGLRAGAHGRRRDRPAGRQVHAGPRFKVGFDQLLAGSDDVLDLGLVLGPLREVRSITAGAVAAILGGADVATSLTEAATQSNALIADYNARN